MSLLKDTDKTRKVTSLPLPYQTSLSMSQLFHGKIINIEKLIQFYEREGVLSPELVIKIINEARQILSMEPNVLQIRDPLVVVGDIHGQYYDLLSILKQKSTEKNKFLFLGDYVDRGLFSIQVIVLILCLKINSPKSIFMLRGNHETRQLTTYFNFRHQCLEFYNQNIYDEFVQLFCSIPLAAIINHRFLCVHGGISPNLQTVKKIQFKIDNLLRIDRFKQVPQSGIFCDILWSDPVEHPKGLLKGLVQFNQIRGCSYVFGNTLTKRFLECNQLSSIIRAHQAKQQGYQMHRWNGDQCFPPVLTFFSAPNYCDFYNNKGAILCIERNVLEITQISTSVHPFYLPNNKTLFQWSIPFIAEKVSQMFHFLLKPDEEEVEMDPIMIRLIDRNQIILQLLKMQQEETQNRIQDTKYQGKLPSDELLSIDQARDYAKSTMQKDFNVQKSIDKVNEKRPKEQNFKEK